MEEVEAFDDAAVVLLAFFADFLGATASAGSATDSAAFRFGIITKSWRKTVVKCWQFTRTSTTRTAGGERAREQKPLHSCMG